MSIIIRDRKYGNEIDVCYSVVDGPNYKDLAEYRVGDKVSILFKTSEDKAKHINELIDPSIRAYPNSSHSDWTVHIQFRVVDRSHGLAWKDAGKLVELSHSVTLEASSGLWEDIFYWVCLNKKPKWAEE